MQEQQVYEGRRRLADPAALALAAFALPLFIWSAFNADYFSRGDENFVIPLAVFVGGPLAIAGAMWAYYNHDAFLATFAGVLGAFWFSFGMLLWLIHNGVVSGPAASDTKLRGFFFV